MDKEEVTGQWDDHFYKRERQGTLRTSKSNLGGHQKTQTSKFTLSMRGEDEQDSSISNRK